MVNYIYFISLLGLLNIGPDTDTECPRKKATRKGFGRSKNIRVNKEPQIYCSTNSKHKFNLNGKFIAYIFIYNFSLFSILESQIPDTGKENAPLNAPIEVVAIPDATIIDATRPDATRIDAPKPDDHIDLRKGNLIRRNILIRLYTN